MRVIVAAGVLACLASGVSAQGIGVRLLPSFVDDVAAEPSVVADGRRGFVVTWQARLDDGVTSLRYRRIHVDGASGEEGEIARGAGWFVNWADFPSLAILDNGDWLAHWLQRSGAGYAYDIHAVRSRDRGMTWSKPALLHEDGTRSEHGFVAFAPSDEGDARAIWLDGRNTAAATASHEHGNGAHEHGGGAMTLRAARVTRDGPVDSVEIDGRVCDCCQTDAARVGDGALVVYRGRSAGEIRDVRLARHDGRVWLATQPLFEDGWRVEGCPVNGPAIAARNRAAIAAAYSEAGGVARVQVRTSVDGGDHWNEAVTVAAGDTMGRVDAVALDGRRFVVSRLDVVGTTVELRVSLHDRLGQVTSTRTVRALPAGKLPGFPRMAAAGDTVLLTWAEVESGSPVVRAALLDVEEGARN